MRMLAGPPDIDLRGPAMHPAAPLIAAKVTDRAHTWGAGPVLDQGVEGDCLAFSWVASCLAQPGGPRKTWAKLANHYARDFAEALGYQQVDGYTLAIRRGMISSYVWATPTAEGFRDAILELGPIAFATPWYDSMFTPTKGGALTVRPHAQSWWHAILITGYHPAAKLGPSYIGPAFRMRNSWGPRWGLHGDCWVTARDLQNLIDASGSAGATAGCVALGRTGTTVATLAKRHPDPRVS